jgi:methyl-coenzyme M reductase subunit C
MFDMATLIFRQFENIYSKDNYPSAIFLQGRGDQYMLKQPSRMGRRTHIVECRATGGTAIGGNLAFPGTLSEAQEPDIVVVAMSPSPRHITKPVCQITYSLRGAGLEVSVLVLSAGTGTSSETAPRNSLGASLMELSDLEVHQIERHRMALIHVGNVPSHFIPKIKSILLRVETSAVILSQAEVEMEDLVLNGIKVTGQVDGVWETEGIVVDLVNGIVRGQRCSQAKIDEIILKTRKALKATSLP